MEAAGSSEMSAKDLLDYTASHRKGESLYVILFLYAWMNITRAFSFL
jgi:hypothetical protein